VSSMWP